MIFGFVKKLIKYYVDKLVHWLRMQKFNLELDNDIKKYHEELDKKVKKPKIIENVRIVKGTIALIKAARIMFQKIANVLSIISFVMVASMSGGAYFGYKYVTSEQFKAKVMNEILGNVQGMMPKLLDNGLPKMTGPSMPIIK